MKAGSGAKEPLIGHNSGTKIVELDTDLLAFAIGNCNANIQYALEILQASRETYVSRELREGMVDTAENFKRLKRALEAAK